MKGSIIALSLIFFAYGVSADWKENFLKQYIFTMDNRVKTGKQAVEDIQKRRGAGAECITTQNTQLTRIISAYPLKIGACLNGDTSEGYAKDCCEREQSYNFQRVQNILQETWDCIHDVIQITSYSPQGYQLT